MTDIQVFIDEIMLFLTEEDVDELGDKAGIRFPLGENWTDLCYLCCWMGMKRELPGSVHNRMVLGEKNTWTELYLKTRARRDVKASELFELAG